MTVQFAAVEPEGACPRYLTWGVTRKGKVPWYSGFAKTVHKGNTCAATLN